MSGYYQRRLPHWQPEGAAVFVTWRLFDSFPRDQAFLLNPTSGQAFAAMDRELNRAATGPRWLEDERIAQVVVNTLHYGESHLKLYDLHAWVIMVKHVHILIHPHVELSRITKSIKNYSAKKTNEILNRTGPFWRNESYDHWVRNEAEFYRIVRYIEHNPVAAELTDAPEHWRWSSAFQPTSAGQEAYDTYA